jgi:hypothetical protein
VPFADQSGEVQTMVTYPQGLAGMANTYAGQQEWLWTASFEAFDSAPARLGQTPDGTYRFVVDGAIRTAGATEAYHLESDGFAVTPWDGITISDIQVAARDVSFVVDPIAYPRTYESPLRFVRDGGPTGICKTCSFRPWATTGTAQSVTVEVLNPAQKVVRTVDATLVDGRWVADTDLSAGLHARIAAGAVRDTWGETNATSYTVGADGVVTQQAAAGAAGGATPAGPATLPSLPISSSRFPLEAGVAVLLALLVAAVVGRRAVRSVFPNQEIQ